MRTFNIALVKGDGIGPEIIDQALRVLDKIEEKHEVKFDYKEVAIGGIGYDTYGDPCSDEALDICKKSDAVLFGAVGGPEWDNLESEKRPEKGLLKLRKGLGVNVNLRPARIYPSLKEASPLKEEIVDRGVDLLVVRELVGGIYFGKRDTYVNEKGLREAYDTEKYDENEIRGIAERAFEIAMTRRKKLTSIDKANVLDSSKLWRKIVEEVAKSYPQVEVNHLYVDNCAMQLVRDPSQFDVVLTNNIFGDILSDEASQITGSIGMLESASLGDSGVNLYEPIHGSAPDIEGKNLANPLATILSAAMMLEMSFDMKEAAQEIRKAVTDSLDAGIFTKDLAGAGNYVTCSEMGDEVIKRL